MLNFEHPASKPQNQEHWERELLEIVQSVADELRHPRRVHATLDSSFDEDLSLDSLGRVELMIRIEQSFHISLIQEQLFEVTTPRELLATLSVKHDPFQYSSQQTNPKTGLNQEKVQSLHDIKDKLPERDPCDKASTLIEVLDWQAQGSPSRIHLSLLLGETRRDLCYEELRKLAHAAGQTLRAQGVLEGDRVALMLPTSIDFFVAFFGIMYAGAIPVPLDPPSGGSPFETRVLQFKPILENAAVAHLITTQAAAKVTSEFEMPVRVIPANELLTESSEPQPPLPQMTGKDIALLQYTAGSTGTPKGVLLTHSALLANIQASGQVLQITPSDVVVSWLPLSFDMGLIGAWLGSLYHGCRLILMPPQSFLAQPQRWLWAIHEFGGTLSAAPNFAYEICASRIDPQALVGLNLNSWRLALNGAEPVNSATLERFRNRFVAYGLRPEAITAVYGLAENCVALTLPRRVGRPRIDTIDRELFQQNGTARHASENTTTGLDVASCGQAIPGHEIRIVHSEGSTNEERREGRVQFRGPSATLGYYRNSKANKSLFDGEWLETGDLGYLADGELFLTGRSKDVIIRAGRNLHPHEVERVVETIEQVRNGGVALLGVPNSTKGTEDLVLVVESQVRTTSKRDQVATRIQTAVFPLLNCFVDSIFFVPPSAIPKTSSGKVRRNECRNLYMVGCLPDFPSMTEKWRSQLVSAVHHVRQYGRSIASSSYSAYGLLLIFLWKITMGFMILVLPGLRRRRRFASAMCRLFLKFARIQWTVTGQSHLSVRPCFILANHQGLLSGVLMQAMSPPWCFFTPKREFAANPMANVFLRRLGTQYVAKDDPQSGLADLEAVKKRIDCGESAMVFPEGTFHEEPGLRKFYMGAFVIAAEMGIPVVPVAIRGARNIWRGKTWMPSLRRGRATVTVMPPIFPVEQDWQAAVTLQRDCRRQILAHAGEFDAEA